MLPSIEMTIESADEEILLLIIATFEIQSCVRGFHFYQDSWQFKLGEILNASNEDKPSSLVHDIYTITRKGKNRKTVGHVLKHVSKQMHFFVKYGGRAGMKVNCKQQYSKDL